MPEAGPATRALLAAGVAGPDDRSVAERVCRACIAGLDVDGAAISVLTASVARETLWASDPVAELLEDLQFGLNEGACMQAATTGSPVLVPVLGEGTEVARWPIFAAAVLEQTPVRALFALPLQWGITNLGVLDLYRKTPGGLSQPQWRDALSAADIGTMMMLRVRTEPDEAIDDHDSLDPDWLDPSFGLRHAEIHQATGMVLMQLGVSATEALARMRAYAFSHQRLLLEVAQDVVHRRLVFTEAME